MVKIDASHLRGDGSHHRCEDATKRDWSVMRHQSLLPVIAASPPGAAHERRSGVQMHSTCK
jgi:hypothetical protein